MKTKHFFLAAIMSMSVFTMNAQSLSVYFCDIDGEYTNIRNAPNGKIVDKVSTDTEGMLTVEKPLKGWWVISNNFYEDPDGTIHKLKGARTLYVHNSCLGVGTRNYGGETLYLRSTPNPNGKVVFTIKRELTFHPIDVRPGWVKLITFDGKVQGWIEEEWLCGNSVTNCN